MSKWFYANIFLLLLVLYQVMTHYTFSTLSLPVLFGLIGFLFYLFNWTRNAMFSSIRTTPDRKRKIKLANISKKVLPFHRWTGTSALIFIILHAVFIIKWYGFSYSITKMVVGLIACLNLFLLVGTGWLRLFKPTGKLRKIHLGLGLSLFFLISLHLIL
ncbi:hypothetical protein [Oceanobacillus senegalensis]|uniref:hypothetical protein n=1 Tax=Oceanobacillus senegalensis TaxID=1936063 RepID=UPI000A30A013|nr:hypothetical protein [Oceanobacillus senegalensis]